MTKSMRNLLIAAAVAAVTFAALLAAEASAPGVDLGAIKFVLPVVIFSGLSAGLNGLAGNRKLPAASGEMRAAALAFPPVAGGGYLVVLRRARSARTVGFVITLDGTVAAQLMATQFVILRLAGGPHRLNVDIPGAPGTSAAAPRDIEMAEGDIMFFETRTVMGLTRTSVHLDPLPDSPDLRERLGKAAMVMPVGPSV